MDSPVNILTRVADSLGDCRDSGAAMAVGRIPILLRTSLRLHSQVVGGGRMGFHRDRGISQTGWTRWCTTVPYDSPQYIPSQTFCSVIVRYPFVRTHSLLYFVAFGGQFVL